ncbi:splicing factor 3A subunit 1 [Onthophagus taurus]|uniref:splicing factor 3A subunit 1 n=1 Tax=Onthophagus taurus TaxID=166361 RepID=UPI000C1FDA68|nr:splicing factor 3A subunit 1 [Onthophagus taurus]XP_022904769.1 splicing factor 3A subunit 1 [Onthophagus taurus]
MPVVDVPVNPPPENQEEPGPINPVVGIIYPPPEVRNIVDKTASFVARNGPEFEARIRQNEIGNPKFNFLNTGDPYHAYYQHKVKDFQEGKGQEPTSGLPAAIAKLSVNVSAQQKQQEILKFVEQPFVPKEPPTEFEFIADPPSISALDLDIVKLTAQFVARNGRQFLTQLMNREQRNFQFDFLRPQHSLFQYFTKLLEQYTKVLIPPKSMQQRLRDEAKSAPAVLDQVKYRAEWLKYQEAQRAKEEEILERERVAYAQIDWHDFVVVETVDYQPFEMGNFPPPTTPEEVGARILIQERVEEGEDIEMQLESDDEDQPSRTDEGLSTMEDHTNRKQREDAKDDNRLQDMDEESSGDEGDSHPNIPQIQPPLPPAPDKVLVKKYDPKQAVKVTRPTVGDDYLISPITGEKIPASKVQEHMRIGLLDPRWVEQRDKHISEKMNQDNVYAAGFAIDASLKQLAERRTDIFGVGDEETAIGKKIGEEDVRKDEKVTWDGHTSSVEAATRAARANITLEEQIHQIHKVKGLLPDEEKEKIGPKNVASKAGKTSAVITGKPQANPNPVPIKPPAPQAPPQATILQVPPQPTMLTAQPPIMMMPAPPIPQMRPPPLMMAAPPPMAGFVTPMPPQMGGQIPMGVKHSNEGPVDDEPINKKMRNEDSLIPEAVFLARNTSPVTIKITIPLNPEKSEWKLNGQTLSYTMPLSETIANVKVKVQEETSMAPAKQKLFYDGMFFKDSNTLAYYNIVPGATIQLQIKERGGRKK